MKKIPNSIEILNTEKTNNESKFVENLLYYLRK